MEKTKYFDMYFEKLENTGVSHEAIETLKEKYGTALNYASFYQKNDTGFAHDGSLMEVSLRKLGAYAVKLNMLFPEELRVDQNSIVKVALLQHLSKAIRLKKSTDEWRVKNLGELYVYERNIPAIGTGVHSVAICNECGIKLTPLEVEAMISIDRNEATDPQFKSYSNMLTHIIKIANELVQVDGQKANKIIQ